MKVVGVGLLLLGSAGGCSAPKACEPSFDGPGKELTGSTEGSFELHPTASPEQIELVAGLTRLPKLWGGSSNLRSGYLQLALTLEYVDEPKGNDGKTEMPRVQTKVSVGSERSFLDPISSSFPNGATTGAVTSFSKRAAPPVTPAAANTGPRPARCRSSSRSSV